MASGSNVGVSKDTRITPSIAEGDELPIQVGIVFAADRRIGLIHQRRGDHVVRGGAVTRGRDVVDDGDPQQGLDVHVVRMRLHRVPEEDDEVDAPLSDHRPQLLIAAQRPGLELDDLDRRPLGAILRDDATESVTVKKDYETGVAGTGE